MGEPRHGRRGPPRVTQTGSDASACLLFFGLGVDGTWNGGGKSPSRTFLFRCWREYEMPFAFKPCWVRTRRLLLSSASASIWATASRQSRPSSPARRKASTTSSNQKLRAMSATSKDALRLIEAHQGARQKRQKFAREFCPEVWSRETEFSRGAFCTDGQNSAISVRADRIRFVPLGVSLVPSLNPSIEGFHLPFGDD